MKICTFFVIGFWLVSASAFGDLSVADWEKLNGMLKESEARTKEYVSQELSREIAKVNAEVRVIHNRIDETNKRMEAGFEGVKAQFEAVNAQFGAVNNRFGDVNSRLNLNFGLLVALIGVVIGLPLLRERKKEREQDEQLEAQKQQLAVQQQLIEAQQEQLAAQQQQLAAVLEELAALKQQQSDDESLTTAAKSGDH